MRAEIKQAFLKGIGRGLSPEQLANGQYLVGIPVKPNGTSGNSMAPLLRSLNTHPEPRPILSSPPLAEINLPAVSRTLKESPATTIVIPKTPALPEVQSKFKYDPKAIVTRMDQDRALHLVEHLYQLVKEDKNKKYPEDYLINEVGLKPKQLHPSYFERNQNIFFALFGDTSSEHKAVAKLLAKDISFGDPDSSIIINGLIKYLEQLGFNLYGETPEMEKRTPGLVKKYSNFVEQQVYFLIKETSKKITCGKQIQLDPNEHLFPQVSNFITAVFGPLAPIEF